MIKIFLALGLSFFLFFTQVQGQNTLMQTAPNSEHTFEHGIELLALENYDAAHAIFSNFISLFPNNLKTLDAQYYEAFCKLKMNNPQGEIQIKLFAKTYPNHPKSIYANYDLGSYYFGLKNYSEAITYLKMVNLNLLDEENKLECNFKLGYSFMNIKAFDKAGPVFQRIKNTKNKYTYAASYYLGYINFKNELYDLAEQNLKKSAENVSYQALVPQVMVNVYMKQRKYDTLIAYSSRVLINQENIKNVEEVYLYTAEAYYQKKDFENAISFYEKYVAKEGKLNDGAQFKYGYALYKTNRFEKAIDQLKPIAEQNDSTGQSAGYYLGLTWLKTGNKAFAFQAFSQTSKMTFLIPINIQSNIEYGKLGIELQRFTEVIEAMKEFLRKYTDGKEVEIANGLLSEAYLNTNDYQSALKHIENVKGRNSALNKVYQQVTYYRATELYNDENYKEAIEMFDKSLQNDADHETTLLSYYWMAETYSIMKQYDEAILFYQKLLKSSFRAPADIEAKNYFGLAFAYYNKQEYAKALPNFKDYIEKARKNDLKDTQCEATIRLADCYYALKKYNEAQTTYQKAVDLQCQNLDYVYLQRGINLALSNKELEAQKVLAKVMPSSKLYYDAVYNIGLIDFENTKYAASIPAFTTVITDRNSDIYVPLALQKRAVAYSNLKQYNKAAEDYQTILSEYPKSKVASNALVGLQEAFTRLNKTELLDSVIQNYKAINPKDEQIELLEFEKAKNAYFDQNYAQAKAYFTKYKSEYSNYNKDALFYLADAFYKTKQQDSAKAYFNELITYHKKNLFYNRSILKMAELLMEEKEYSDAIINFQTLVKVSQNPKETSNAWNGLMTAYFEVKNYDSSSNYASIILEKASSTIQITNRASLYLAKSALELKKSNAMDLLINCFNAANDVNGAEAMYLYATELHKSKNYKLSLEILFDLTSRFIKYDKYVGISYLLIAENYSALKEHYQAKATLISIIEKSTDETLVEKAKLRLAELNNNN